MGSLRFASQTASLASQASQLPQILWCSKQLRLARDNVGAGLPAMGSLRFASQIASQASQLLQVPWCPKKLRLARDNVGAGLLAMASLRFASQTASQASQASQLPHLCLMHDLR